MMKIVVSDDDAVILNMIAFRLKKDGYTDVFLASDGRQALELIKEHEPDLIITDILMPFVSGLEVVNFVKNELKLSTPIIVLSAVGLEDTVLEAFEMGADDFMTKPFSLPELSVRIKKMARIASRDLKN